LSGSESIVGIDLGTTNSLIAVFRDGKPELIPTPHGGFLTPSIVGALEDETIIVGRVAKEWRVTNPERCASRFKRAMGTATKFAIGKHSFSAPELSSVILKSLIGDAESYLNQSVTKAVITVPAYFNEHQRRATRLAGELAGLEVVRIINEPTAAALTYGFHERDATKKLLVIDLGGGTFDVTLMEVFEGALEIIATAGESMLGGEDFTDRMVSRVLQQHGHSFEVIEQRHPRMLARLRRLCEDAKTAFLENEWSTIAIPELDGNILSSAAKTPVHREEFAQWMVPLLDRLLPPIIKVLRDGQTEPSGLDDIILVGGATRMKCLQEFVADRLKAIPKCSFNPDEVVALGAAVQAAFIADDKAVEDMVMTDVCPHTLGIEIVKLFGEQRIEGFFSPVIHRNTTIPVSREEHYSTLEQNQSSVKIRIFQGESRKVSDNLFLGELSVEGLPKGPPGSLFAVRFTYDSNGILEVEAYVPSTGRRYATVIANSASHLSRKEIDAALKKMQGIKFYPRDDAENQNLLRFCERVIGEIEPRHRAELESVVDQWERSMSIREPEFFREAKDGLLAYLESIGFPYSSQ
jgi:molecular chaperone HscC